MLQLKTGQIFVVTNQNGLLVLTERIDDISADQRIGVEKKIYSRKVPVGDIILCLEIISTYNNSRYFLKILWKEKIYYAVCEAHDVRII